jgi:RNA polymerase sigma factor (sigma-70 family)
MLRIFHKNKENQLTDDALVSQFTETGNSQTLGLLYERYMPLIYGICLKYLKDPTAAEDAVMQIYEQVAKKLAESNVQQFKPWVCTVARNHCLMEIRKHKNHLIEPIETHHLGDIAQVEWSIDSLDREAQLNQLERCLEQLIETQQTKVRMFYFEDRTYQEISQLTSTDLGMVRSHIQNGRRNLRNCMDGINPNKPD